MSDVSTTHPELFLLDNMQDFKTHALKLAEESRRTIVILSRHLDPEIYNSTEFSDAISRFVRSSPNAQVQILVKNTKHLVESGHKLVKLHQRISSKILLRKLTVEPDDSEMGFMLCDTNALLYKNDDSVYRGFANYAATVEVKRFREQFDYVWQYAEPEPELQLLNI